MNAQASAVDVPEHGLPAAPGSVHPTGQLPDLAEAQSRFTALHAFDPDAASQLVMSAGTDVSTQEFGVSMVHLGTAQQQPGPQRH